MKSKKSTWDVCYLVEAGDGKPAGLVVAIRPPESRWSPRESSGSGLSVATVTISQRALSRFHQGGPLLYAGEKCVIATASDYPSHPAFDASRDVAEKKLQGGS